MHVAVQGSEPAYGLDQDVLTAEYNELLSLLDTVTEQASTASGRAHLGRVSTEISIPYSRYVTTGTIGMLRRSIQQARATFGAYE
jgi:hypothetical protein